MVLLYTLKHLMHCIFMIQNWPSHFSTTGCFERFVDLEYGGVSSCESMDGFEIFSQDIMFKFWSEKTVIRFCQGRGSTEWKKKKFFERKYKINGTIYNHFLRTIILVFRALSIWSSPLIRPETTSKFEHWT